MQSLVQLDTAGPFSNFLDYGMAVEGISARGGPPVAAASMCNVLLGDVWACDNGSSDPADDIRFGVAAQQQQQQPDSSSLRHTDIAGLLGSGSLRLFPGGSPPPPPPPLKGSPGRAAGSSSRSAALVCPPKIFWLETVSPLGVL